jgi:hypothetical protein
MSLASLRRFWAVAARWNSAAAGFIALCAADPAITSIADLARACGFGQLGRFIAA